MRAHNNISIYWMSMSEDPELEDCQNWAERVLGAEPSPRVLYMWRWVWVEEFLLVSIRGPKKSEV